MPDRGTPQGAVLSPMLFNLTLIPLAPTLLTSPTLRSTLYADDIALWVHSGSDQHIEATLQHGLNRKYVTQTTHLIKRIATKHHGTKEQDRLRLVHSFLLNHAHHMSQLTRFASSRAGHCILNTTINILPSPSQSPHSPFHRTYKARRLARANIHAKQYPPSPCTLYIDATPYSHKPAHCVTVLGKHPPPNVMVATILTTNTTMAEEAAIALALAQSPTPQFVLSDSQQAIRNFIPHTGVGANEMVHDRNRELIDRAANSTAPTRDAPAGKPTSLLQYRDITLHYRSSAANTHPRTPHLFQEAAHMLRSYKTHTFPHRTQLINTHPYLFTTPPVLLAGARHSLPFALRMPPQTHTPHFPPLTSGSRCCATRRSQPKVLTTSWALAVAAFLWASTIPNT
ncbi:hypothetical protein HPB47_004415 [Ixodes persulcatus]|uniref:Uncharacterized protein n=1 Tax=Ixodes persulcatus TaxID=34615 RepID=A0AC60PGV2_IXOPE|nr:hypothetical protein HPB47_004415 [Ixodes persulcatus]